MAIVTPLLLLLLFGIIQYGMLFHTMQAASATARDAARRAAEGVSDCGPYADGVRNEASGTGIPTNPAAWKVTMTYHLTPSQGNPSGTVEVALEYTPQSYITFIPMPGRLTQTAIAPVEDASGIKVTQCVVDP
jgi:Flp pilus assembly protein TadG